MPPDSSQRPAPRPSGMTGFTLVWIGQIVSLLGTSMTNFALTIWAYQTTGSATALALVSVFFMTPLLLVSPVAGAIVDRSNRKKVMMISDLASGLMTIVIFLLLLSDRLEIWHLYITAAITGAFQAFQWPAYSAAITMMLPKEQYARANGMIELAGSASNIFAPLLAGALLGLIGLQGIIIIDIATFLIAIGALAVVHIPQPPQSEEGREGQSNLWKESLYGFQYILARRSLLGLQCVFLLGNFFTGLAFTLFAPMILARTNNNELIFGSVQSAGAVGAVVGGLIMGAWGGPRRRIHGVLGGWFLSSLLGTVVVGIGQSFPIWIFGAFVGSIFIPIINGSNQAIWQAKVAPDVQGRVFSARRLIAWVTNPLSALIAGPLADHVMEPAMSAGGVLVPTFGWLTGTGPGAGMALIFVFAGTASMLVGLGGYAWTTVREAEEILPDHVPLPASSGATS